jgi:hypothetical protein
MSNLTEADLTTEERRLLNQMKYTANNPNIGAISAGWFDIAVPKTMRHKYRSIGHALKLFICTNQLLSCITPERIPLWTSLIHSTANKIHEFSKNDDLVSMEHLHLTKRLLIFMRHMLYQHAHLFRNHPTYAETLANLEQR